MSKSTSRSAHRFFPLALSFSAISSALALVIYAYLGIFTRHLADDYCIADMLSGNFFVNLWKNYLTVSDRFLNHIFIALSESISPLSTAILPSLMLILWVVGLAWLLREASMLAGQGWPKSVTLTLSLMFVFYAILQAPNRYQTLYWRASVAAHLVPLVLMPSLASFLLGTIRSAAHTPPARWVYPLTFFLAFILGDFSEPADAVQIIVLGLALLAVWMWMKMPVRTTTLHLLSWTATGALAAMLIMAISPANAFRLGSPPPSLPLLISRSIIYSYQFIVEGINGHPLPSILTFITPMLVFYCLFIQRASGFDQNLRKRMLLVMAVVPLISFLLIIASFAPSVYGQGFPLERTRFAGEVCLLAALMIEGACLGALLSQWRPRILGGDWQILVAAFLLGIMALYPLRMAWLTLQDVQVYRERAAAWDARDALIRSLKAQGKTDLVIPQFDGVEGVKELDVSRNHWVNRCAAQYYNVHSIRALPPNGP